MNPLGASLGVSLLLAVVILLGDKLRRVLPEAHLTDESKDTLKLAMGLVATMTALVMGLLINSTKRSYDASHREVLTMAAKIGMMDRVLSAYGDETREIQAEFHRLGAALTDQIWSADPADGAAADRQEAGGNALFTAVHGLQPRNATQVDLKARALGLALQIAESRLAIVARRIPAVSVPLVFLIVAWLVVIYLGFSIMAAPNGTARLALILSALSAAGGLFLVCELDQPFDGVLTVSRDALDAAIDRFGR